MSHRLHRGNTTPQSASAATRNLYFSGFTTQLLLLLAPPDEKFSAASLGLSSANNAALERLAGLRHHYLSQHGGRYQTHRPATPITYRLTSKGAERVAILQQYNAAALLEQFQARTYVLHRLGGCGEDCVPGALSLDGLTSCLEAAYATAPEVSRALTALAKLPLIEPILDGPTPRWQLTPRGIELVRLLDQY